ncbi:MAG TPA: ribbon-helix-helix protein, CopG family [Thiohalobacter sp.]|nr:ribbon-helix-helix protein, CopG family [Thiohalobacter sp.]
MAAISLRLPEDVENRLNEEARRERRPRSEVVRQAITDYLERRERERFISELVAEAKAVYGDEARRREAIELAEDAVATGNEALDIAEGREPGTPWPEETDEKWWR